MGYTCTLGIILHTVTAVGLRLQSATETIPRGNNRCSPQTQEQSPSPESASRHRRPCACQTRSRACCGMRCREYLCCLACSDRVHQHMHYNQRRHSSRAARLPPFARAVMQDVWETYLCVMKIFHPSTTCASGMLLSVFQFWTASFDSTMTTKSSSLPL